MSIKIYGDPGSGSLRRVTSAAAIMGIPVERMHVDLLKGESHTPEFLKNLNPHGLTPVMVDGDVTLYESSAINLYLAEKVGSDLLGVEIVLARYRAQTFRGCTSLDHSLARISPGRHVCEGRPFDRCMFGRGELLDRTVEPSALAR